jgi:hypothetical protein
VIGIASRPAPSGVDVGRGDGAGTDVAGGADTAGGVGRPVGAAVPLGLAVALGVAGAVGSAEPIGVGELDAGGWSHHAADRALTAKPAEGDDRDEADRGGHGTDRAEGRRSDG